jgi:hypothetical protein
LEKDDTVIAVLAVGENATMSTIDVSATTDAAAYLESIIFTDYWGNDDLNAGISA